MHFCHLRCEIAQTFTVVQEYYYYAGKVKSEMLPNVLHLSQMY